MINKKKHRCNSLFAHLFASIMVVTIAILAAQATFMAIMLKNQEREFTANVFQSYARRLQDYLDQGLHEHVSWTLESVQSIVKRAADDRVSGLILRDSEQNAILTFGKTPKGLSITTVELDTPNERYQHDGFEPLNQSQWFVDSNFSRLYVTTETLPGEQQVVMVRYPEPVRKQDVIGTVMLYSDAAKEEVFGSVDVLVFSPMNYSMTSLLMQRMIQALLITIPIALIVALIGARWIASTVSRHAKQVSKSLESVANGNGVAVESEPGLKELAEIAASVERLDQQLKRNEKTRQQWLRSIAHDLNTPVTALKISIEGAIDNVLPVDEALLARMKRESEELERRVASVLTLSAMENLDYGVHMDKIATLDFIDEVVRSSFLEKRISLDVRIDSFTGDTRLLIPACRELLKNAGKYSPEQSVITWRLFACIDTGRSVVMEFENVGHVDSEILNQVFEPWVRGDQSRNSEGSGLGLSIVRQAIQLHGGDIAMHNTEDGHVVVRARW